MVEYSREGVNEVKHLLKVHAPCLRHMRFQCFASLVASEVKDSSVLNCSYGFQQSNANENQSTRREAVEKEQ